MKEAETLTQLNEFGWFNVISVIILVIVFLPNLIESWKKFTSSIGLKSVNELEEEKLNKTISSLREQVAKLEQKLKGTETSFNNQIQEIKNNRIHDRQQSLDIQDKWTQCITKMMETLEDMRSDILDDKIDGMRWKILDFANQLRRNGRVSYLEEQFSNVLKTYDDYEEILRKHKKKNGQVEESIKFIREMYHEMLMEHACEPEFKD